MSQKKNTGNKNNATQKIADFLRSVGVKTSTRNQYEYQELTPEKQQAVRDFYLDQAVIMPGYKGVSKETGETVDRSNFRRIRFQQANEQNKFDYIDIDMSMGLAPDGTWKRAYKEGSTISKDSIAFRLRRKDGTEDWYMVCWIQG